MKVMLLCVALLATTAIAHADRCKNNKLVESEAKGAAEILSKAGEYLQPDSLLGPPTVVQVTSAEASEDTSKWNEGKGLWHLTVNGARMGRLTDIYVPSSAGPPGTFSPLWEELGCGKWPPKSYRKGPANPKDPLPFLLGVDKVEASSTLVGHRLFTEAVMDGNNGSAWCEGKRGPGIGEQVTIRFATPQVVSTMRIAAAPKKYNSPTALDVTVNGAAPAQRIRLTPGETLGLPRIGIKTLTIRIAKAPNEGLARTCIGEVRLSDGARQYALVRGVNRLAMAAVSKDVPAIIDAVRSCNAAAMAKYVAFPLHSHYYGSDEAGHYEPGETTWRSARALAAACRRAPRGHYLALHLRQNSAPYFAASDVHAAGEMAGKIILNLGSDGGEYWRLGWTGSKWRLEAASDIPEQLCEGCN